MALLSPPPLSEPPSVDRVPNTELKPPAPDNIQLKIQRVAFYALGVLATVSSVVFGYSVSIIKVGFLSQYSFVLVPLLIVALYFFRKGCTMIDYENPQVLERLREEAKQQTLSQLEYVHGGLEPLFKYEILNPENFLKAFFQLIQSWRIENILGIYKRVEAGVLAAKKNNVYQLPDLSSLQETFIAETRSMEFSEIMDNKYLFERLIELRIVDASHGAKLLELKQEYSQAKINFNLSKGVLQPRSKDYGQTLELITRQFFIRINKINESYLSYLHSHGYRLSR